MDNVMSQENSFTYKYSAAENQEIQEIRNRYLPQSERASFQQRGYPCLYDYQNHIKN